MLAKLCHYPWFLKALALYLRHSRIERGRWRLVLTALPIARKVLRDEGSRIVKTHYGFRMKVELDDWLGQHVYLTGDYEPQNSRVMHALLEPGATMIDIGANLGYFVLLAGRAVGPTGKVLAFEPVPWTREQLLENIQLNHMPQCTVRSEALADEAGSATFYEGPAEHRGISSLRPLDNASRQFDVQLERLDALVPSKSPVRLVKIDVEGAEMKVLRGMVNLLDAQQPDFIIEVTDEFLRKLGDSAEALCDFFTNRGFRMFEISPHGLVPFERWSTKMPRQFDALFTRREQLSPQLFAPRDKHPGY